MPKRKTTDENSINISPRHYLSEPDTIYIMREMDVKPLNSPPYSDESIYESDTYSEKKPLQTVNGTKKRVLVIPEKSPSFKAYRDDYVFFQKSPPFQVHHEDYFAKLSDEIILQIFHLLPKTTLIKCAEVCKRWKSISYDETLWTRVDLGKKYIQPGVIETLFKRGVTILRLATCEIKEPIFRSPEFTCGERFSRIRFLDLSMATISPESLAHILGVCNTLKKLSLEACALSDDCCRFIARNKELEVLNMCLCSGLTAVGLKEITEECARLKEWNLAWTQLSTDCLQTFLPYLPNSLTKFNISGHPLSFDDNALITVAKCCPNLTELDINDCLSVTGASFMVLIENCKRLQHLHTSRCYNIPTEFNRFLRSLKDFKYLEVFRTLNEEGMSAVKKFLPGVKINTQPFSTIARPTTGIKRTSIWGMRVRE